MTSVRRSSPACILLIALGCNPGVIESASDDIAEASTTSGDSDASSEASDDASSTSTTTTTSDTSTGDTSTGDTSTGDTSTETNPTTSTDDPMMCSLGTLDCECDAGNCEVGLLCVAGVCVEEVATDTTDTTDTGVEPHNCGWVLRKEFYFCGGDGVDPSMQNPADCDEFDFPMVEGAPCGAELNYVGCCDAMGDAWYCLQGFIEYDVCRA